MEKLGYTDEGKIWHEIKQLFKFSGIKFYSYSLLFMNGNLNINSECCILFMEGLVQTRANSGMCYFPEMILIIFSRFLTACTISLDHYNKVGKNHKAFWIKTFFLIRQFFPPLFFLSFCAMSTNLLHLFSNLFMLFISIVFKNDIINFAVPVASVYPFCFKYIIESLLQFE